MFFYKKIMKFAMLLAIFNIKILVGSEGIININDDNEIFIERMKVRYPFIKKSENQLNAALFKEIKSVLEKLSYHTTLNLLDKKTQLYAYFEETIADSIQDYQDTFLTNSFDQDYADTFFTNPFDQKIKDDYEEFLLNGKKVSLAEIKNHDKIFNTYFKPFILEVSKLEDNQFNLLLPIAANLAFFAFSDRSTLLRFIGEIKKINDINQQNKLMQIFMVHDTF